MKSQALSHSFRASWHALAFGWLLSTALLLLWPVSVQAAGGNKSATQDSPFIGQTQIAATVMQSFRPVGVFQVDMGILVINPTARTRAASLQPVLRDAWRRTTQEFANSYLVRGRVPDAVLLSQRLQAITDQILGQGNARVLLNSVIVR